MKTAFVAVEADALEHARQVETIVARIQARAAEARPFVLVAFGGLCALHGRKFAHVLLFVQSFNQRGLPAVMRRVRAFAQSYAAAKQRAIASFHARSAYCAAEARSAAAAGEANAPTSHLAMSAAQSPHHRLSTLVRVKAQMRHLATDMRHGARRGALLELAAQLLAPKLIVDVVIALYTATMSALVSCMSAGAAKFALGTTLGRFIALHIHHRACSMCAYIDPPAKSDGTPGGPAAAHAAGDAQLEERSGCAPARAPRSALARLIRRWIGAASTAGCAGVGLLCAWRAERVVSTVCTCYMGAQALVAGGGELLDRLGSGDGSDRSLATAAGVRVRGDSSVAPSEHAAAISAPQQGAGEEEAEERSDAVLDPHAETRWIITALTILGYVHQRTEKRNPLPVVLKMFLWPVLLLEARLKGINFTKLFFIMRETVWK
jgi:hypothetical protein